GHYHCYCHSQQAPADSAECDKRGNNVRTDGKCRLPENETSAQRENDIAHQRGPPEWARIELTKTVAIMRLATSQVHTDRQNEQAEKQEPGDGTNVSRAAEKQTDSNCQFDEGKDK